MTTRIGTSIAQPTLVNLSAILLLLLVLTQGIPTATAQTIVKRDVVAGGGGISTSTGHIVNGTISQTAVGRLTHNTDDRHDVGFWYWGYRPSVVVHVALPSLEAQVGTHVTVPMTISVQNGDGGLAPRPFHARVRFNHTLLHSAGTTPPCTADTGDCSVEISGIATTENGTIAQLEFITALGDSERTALTIDEFTWEHKGEERIATVRDNGDLGLLGVCREGGRVRLIHSGAYASRISVSPNPASGRVMMQYVSAETGPVEIRLVDMLGNDVMRLGAADAQAQQLYNQEIDLSAIASGSYMVVFNTPSERQTQNLLITQ